MQELFKDQIIDNIDFENTLIIHFRGGDSSGDITWKHPPYYFYKNIIDNSNYEKILLVIEDNSNPVIKKLLDNYQNVSTTTNDYFTDFKIIKNSIHLVDSQSSFTSSALLLNNKLKTLYTTPQMHKYRKNYNNVNVINYDLDNYTNKIIFNNHDEYYYHLLLDNDPNK